MGKIILGTVQFGLNYGINNTSGMPDSNEVRSIMDYAYSQNVTYLDTAEAYGNSHEVIGNYHGKSKNRFKVTTKYCSSRIDLPQNISERIHYHLEILNVNGLYCYMFHTYDDYKNYFDLFRLELIELRNKGIIQKIGVSLHDNQDIYNVLRNKDIDLIQFPYNLFDNKLKREKVFLKAKESGVEIHTRSTFLQGLFFKELDSLEGNLLEMRKYLRELKQIVDKSDIGSLALSYVASNKNVDGILLGVDNVRQLKLNLSSIQEDKFLDVIGKVDTINIREDLLLNPANW